MQNSVNNADQVDTNSHESAKHTTEVVSDVNPGRIRRFVGARVRPLKKLLVPAQNTNHYKGLYGRVMSVILEATSIVTGRHPSAKVEKTINQAEQGWGITDDNRDTVIKGHYVEFVLFVLICIFGLYQIYSGIFNTSIAVIAVSKLVGGFLLVFATLIRISILMWRVDVLKQQRWVSYSRWLQGK